MRRLPNLFLIGPMGAGKSTVGRALARQLQMDFHDSDQEIEARTGADIAWIFDLEGEDGFRFREKEVIDELSQMSNVVLATGGGAITTAENRQHLAARGTVIYLRTTLEEQFRRTRRDEKRPMLQTDDVKQRLKELWSQREPLYEEISDLIFDTDFNSVKFVANQIIELLHNDKNK